MSESTSIATTGNGITLRQQVQTMEHQFALAAPKGVEARQIVRDVLTAISQTPKLAECDPRTVLGAAMTMAQLGLRIGVLGHGWILPFWDGKDRCFKAQLIVGYQGLVELAHRSGRIESISAREVRENDHFHIEYGVNENLVHRPASGDRGAIVGYYAVARYLPHGHSFYYLTKAEAEVYRDRYAMAKTKGGQVVGPWKTEFDAMAKKTCVRQLSKMMPKGTDLLASGLAADETVRVDLDPALPPEAAGVHPERSDSPDTVHVGEVVTEADAPADVDPFDQDGDDQ